MAGGELAGHIAIPRKKRFEFEILKGEQPVLKYGATGEDVRALQTFLTGMGYLGRDRAPGQMCDCTCAALKHFQKCYGLKDTGEADEETLHLIQRPRCGVPDLGPEPAAASGPAPFVLRGCKYHRADLTFAFLSGTPDLPDGQEREIVRAAFAAWSTVSPLRFTEATSSASPTFTIAWEQMDHGDGTPFDNGGSIAGNTLAHAFFPPPCGGTLAGALHFDEFERWTDQAAPGAIRLLNVAIHEIGHLLGLDHSNNRQAIMFAFYDDNVDRLQQDDINGIQALYGPPRVGPTPIRGRLQGDGDHQVHPVIAQPGPMRVTLRGPQGQDFDLYVRVGQPPTRAVFDARGFTASPTEEVRLNVPGGEVFIMVDAWRGRGSYEVQIAFG